MLQLKHFSYSLSVHLSDIIMLGGGQCSYLSINFCALEIRHKHNWTKLGAFSSKESQRVKKNESLSILFEFCVGFAWHLLTLNLILLSLILKYTWKFLGKTLLYFLSITPFRRINSFVCATIPFKSAVSKCKEKHSFHLATLLWLGKGSVSALVKIPVPPLALGLTFLEQEWIYNLRK